MDLNLKTKTINTNELAFESTVDQPIDGDITMPDYCPNIKRVIKSTVKPKIISSDYSGDRVSVEANAYVQIIYSGEDNKIYCYDKTFPFSKNIEIGKQIENPTCDVNLKLSYCNCRVVNERRIDFHSSVSINSKIYSKKEVQLLYDSTDCGIQLLKNCNNLVDFKGETIKTFNLNETIDLGENKKDVFQILNYTASVVSGEIKVINNKTLIKGNLIINILYCTSSDDYSVENFEHSIPISQIIECNGTDETTTNLVTMSVSNVDLYLKSNSSGEKKSLDINADIKAIVRSESKVEECFATDCYSTDYEINYENEDVSYKSLEKQFDENFLIKSKIELNNINIDEIYSVWCDSITSNNKIEDNNIYFNGKINICILGKDKNQTPFYVEKTIDYENKIPINAIPDRYDIICETEITSSGYILSGQNCLDLRAEIYVNGGVYSRNCYKLIKSITLDESKKKETKSSLIIYFADSDEDVWSIARKFNTTVRAINEENIFENGIAENRQMIFIPII